MAQSLFDTLQAGASRNSIALRTDGAKNWFRKEVKKLGSVTPAKVLKDEALDPQSKYLVGNMYMYFYEFEIKMPFLNDNEWAKLDFSSAKNILKEGHSVLDRIYTFIDSK